MRNMGLRQSMSWLHTWSGLVLGWLCFAIFLTGTTAYFRQEITSWMQPESVPSAAVTTVDAARVAFVKLENLAPKASQWKIRLPGERHDDLAISWQMPGEGGRGGRPGRAVAGDLPLEDEIMSRPEQAGMPDMNRENHAWEDQRTKRTMPSDLAKTNENTVSAGARVLDGADSALGVRPDHPGVAGKPSFGEENRAAHLPRDAVKEQNGTVNPMRSFYPPESEVAPASIGDRRSMPDASSSRGVVSPSDAQRTRAEPPALDMPASGQEIGLRRGGRGKQLALDPASGEIVRPRETAGGDFLYNFHFELYAMPREWARWIVGVATMAMFLAIISGIITHKKIFADFFTFRPGKGQRSWLDFHNLSGVLSLPFHLMITYSGLVLLASTLLPIAHDHSQFQNRANQEQRRGGDGGTRQVRQSEEESRSRPKDAIGATAIGPLLVRAERDLGEPIAQIEVSDPGTPRARVTLYAAYNNSLLQSGHDGGMARSVSFSGASGEFLDKEEKQPNTVASLTHNVIGGLHRGAFAGPLLRWLFFLSGLLGTVMIATGLVLWSVKRADKRKGKPGGFGHRLVDVLNVGAISGMTIAVGGYFWANRLLPVDLAGRANWEIRCFFLVWLVTFIHSLIRPLKRAWIEQLVTAGLLFATIPILDLVTGDASLTVTLPTGNWIVAGFDITACVTGIALLQTAWKVHRHRGRMARTQGVPNTIPAQAME